MRLFFQNADIYVSDLNYRLGSVHCHLEELAAAKRLSNPVEVLAKNGYQYNYVAGPDETLISMATGPLSCVLKMCPNPDAFVFHHSYGESAMEPRSQETADLMSRARYFPVSMLRHLQIDHVPYFGTFASGCSGFISSLLAARGLVSPTGKGVVCFTGDIVPPGATFDALHEKILTSDVCSSFLVGSRPGSYQFMAAGWYTSPRILVPLVEIVKRTVTIIRELAAELKLDLPSANVLVHYPNIFPEAWNMVTQYLRIPKASHVQDQFQDRSHCLSTDSVITLSKLHSNRNDQWHIVINFGSGTHLGVCVLREQATHVTPL